MSWEKSEDVFRLLSYPQGYFLSQLSCTLTEKDRPWGDCFGHWPAHAFQLWRRLGICLSPSLRRGSLVRFSCLPTCRDKPHQRLTCEIPTVSVLLSQQLSFVCLPLPSTHRSATQWVTSDPPVAQTAITPSIRARVLRVQPLKAESSRRLFHLQLSVIDRRGPSVLQMSRGRCTEGKKGSVVGTFCSPAQDELKMSETHRPRCVFHRINLQGVTQHHSHIPQTKHSSA